MYDYKKMLLQIFSHFWQQKKGKKEESLTEFLAFVLRLMYSFLLHKSLLFRTQNKLRAKELAD